MNRPWRFDVSDRFRITGRGVAVVGTLSGTIQRIDAPGEIHAGGTVTPVPSVWVEFLLRSASRGEEEVALLLRGVELDQVPVGAVIYPPEEQQQSTAADPPKHSRNRTRHPS